MCAVGVSQSELGAVKERKGHGSRKKPRQRNEGCESKSDDRFDRTFVGIHTVSSEKCQQFTCPHTHKAIQQTKQTGRIFEATQGKQEASSRDNITEPDSLSNSAERRGDDFYLKWNLDDALASYKESLDISKKNHGKVHPQAIAVLEKVCSIYFLQGKESVSQLKRHLRKLLNMVEEVYGWRHEVTSLAYRRLGDAHRLLGDFDSALECYTSALTIRWILCHLGQGELIRLLQRFGDIYFAKGCYQRAWSTYSEISRLERQIEAKKRTSALTVHKMGLLMHVAGNNREAATMLHASVDLRREEEEELRVMLCCSGADSVEVVVCDEAKEGPSIPSLDALDECFVRITSSDMLQNVAKANESNDSTIVISGDENHIEIRKISWPIWTPDGDLEIGRPILSGEKVVRFAAPLITSVHSVPNPGADVMKELFYSGADINGFRKEKHTDYCKALAAKLDRIGAEEFNKGNYSESLQALTHALKIKTDALGHEQLSASRTLLKIGDVHSKQMVWEKALTAYESALSLQKHGLGNDNIGLVPILNKIGRLRQKLGRHDAVVALYQEVLDIREKHLGSNHLLVAMAHDCVGDLRLRSGEMQKAAHHFCRSLEIKKAQLGERHKDIAPALERYARALNATGQKRMADKCSLEAQSISKESKGQHGSATSSSSVNIVSELDDESYGKLLIEL